MDRDEFLSLLRQNSTSLEFAYKLLLEYCVVEHNKSLELTKIFINMLISAGMMSAYLQYVIDYYKRKFVICEVKRLDNNQILYMY